MKIFRKIRQEVLSNGQKRKYLKYAMGELILVVLGILIAIQLNLWNEQRKSTNTLKANLNGVLEELKNDSQIIEQTLDLFKKSNQNRIAFINELNYEKYPLSHLEQSLENFNKELNIEYSYFKKIRNSGITEYDKYEDVMKALISYYENTLPYLKKLTTGYDSQVSREDEFWRYEQNTYEFQYVSSLNPRQPEELAKKELIRLLNSPRARNILKIDVRRNQFMIERLKIILPKLKNTVTELETVLEKTNS